MKVLDQTPDRLLLEENPLLLGVLLAIAVFLPLALAVVLLVQGSWFGLIPLAVAAFLALFLVLFVVRTRVLFDRPAGHVVIRLRRLTGETAQVLPLADIRAARVETSISRSTPTNGGTATVSETHRAVLLTPQGEVPLTTAYSAGDGAERMAQAINDWLQP
ncbi:hypothetical protein [Tabrizicola aquatica]|uniref:hypothetical protein n=1 Tax=Tabrizicola aquatica TaxID=909926 RepID=UPI000CD10322|nr:hypothetical protein [Tabrizicola aquatica]